MATGIMELRMSKQLFATELNNREFFIRRWEREFPAFLEVCKALPSGKLEYRPHPQSRSAGELVALLVSVEQSCVDLCVTGRSSYNSGLRFHPTSGFTALDEMIAAYEQHHRALAEKLADLDDVTWNRSACLIPGIQEV